jgi:hypothetical protein
MLRILGNIRRCVGAASAVLVLGAGCGTGHETAGSAASSAAVPPRSEPSVTGVVKRADFLTGVACASAGTCVAVGSYYGTAGLSQTLAARQIGQAWLAEPTPSRGRDSQLDSVSCASASSCVAVGAPAEAWTGTRWTIIPSAGPVSSVSCVAPSYCQAVGVAQSGRRPVAALWDGRGWQAEPMPGPVPGSQDLTMAGVSCTSATFCVAVGDYIRGAGARPSRRFRDRTLAEVWNGSRWRIVRTPNPARQSRFGGVSCTSPAACTAVGSSAGGQWTLAERWDGVRWAIQRTPNVNQIGYSALTAVSCASRAECMAVGTYNLSVGIAEHWNGTVWTIQRLPVPPAAPGATPVTVPVSVSCTGVTACVTVGTTENVTMAERWNGSVWAIEPTPNPA